MISEYWRQVATSDALSGWPPKTKTFFLCWFGPSGEQKYESYINAYRAAKRGNK